MTGFGRYSPLREAHRRAHKETQARKEVRATAMEVTDRKAERRDRDQAIPQRAEQAGRGREEATSPARPVRPVEAAPRTLVPNSPAPGESEGHFAWRRLVMKRIEREDAGRTVQKAGEISRIVRTETNPISRSTELKAAFDRQEAERARQSMKAEKEKTAPERGIEQER